MIIGSVGLAIGVAVVAFFIFALIVVFLKSSLKVVQQGCVGVVKRFGEFKTARADAPGRPDGQGRRPRVPADG
jgi:regulator of protease activity HflC (stomatin/prohibitin superfamily)